MIKQTIVALILSVKGVIGLRGGNCQVFDSNGSSEAKKTDGRRAFDRRFRSQPRLENSWWPSGAVISEEPATAAALRSSRRCRRGWQNWLQIPADVPPRLTPLNSGVEGDGRAKINLDPDIIRVAERATPLVAGQR